MKMASSKSVDGGNDCCSKLIIGEMVSRCVAVPIILLLGRCWSIGYPVSTVVSLLRLAKAYMQFAQSGNYP